MSMVGAVLKRRNATTDGGRALVSLVLALAVLTAPACTRLAAPSPVSPRPDTARSPTAPEASLEPSGNPEGVPTQYFMTGNHGVVGPTVFLSGLVSFMIGNNSNREHRFIFVRVASDESEAGVSARVCRAAGDWPPASTEVLARARMPSGQRVATVRFAPLEPGSYALVDVAADPRSGQPYACQGSFVRIVGVVPPS